MKTRRRDIEIFSLSFLDCICCAFGAIILLFVLSKFAEPVIIEEIREDLQAEIVRLEEEIHEIRGETVVLNRELVAKKEQLSTEKKRLGSLKDPRRIRGIQTVRSGAKHRRRQVGSSASRINRGNETAPKKSTA
jgi:predicted  nucleic acid-binding Zn-ribbon protein